MDNPTINPRLLDLYGQDFELDEFDENTAPAVPQNPPYGQNMDFDAEPLNNLAQPTDEVNDDLSYWSGDAMAMQQPRLSNQPQSRPFPLNEPSPYQRQPRQNPPSEPSPYQTPSLHNDAGQPTGQFSGGNLGTSFALSPSTSFIQHGLNSDMNLLLIPSVRDVANRQFEAVRNILSTTGNAKTKEFVVRVIDFARNFQRNLYGLVPPVESVLTGCFEGKTWAQAHVERILEWMETSYRFRQLDGQLAQLEQFLAQVGVPDMKGNWSEPIPDLEFQDPANFDSMIDETSGLSMGPTMPDENPVPPFLSAAPAPFAPPARSVPVALEPLPEISASRRYQGYAASRPEANMLFSRYLAQNNRPPRSMEGYPMDHAGQCRLVREAFEAMVQIEGCGEAAEVANGKRKPTALNRIEQNFWNDLEYELMAWRLLAACWHAQMGRCEVPNWFSDGRLSNQFEYPTFRARWDDLVKTLRSSKKIVNALFDVPFAMRMAWNTHGESKRKETNYTGNLKKGEFYRNRQAASEQPAPTAPEADTEPQERVAKRPRLP